MFNFNFNVNDGKLIDRNANIRSTGDKLGREASAQHRNVCEY